MEEGEQFSMTPDGIIIEDKVSDVIAMIMMGSLFLV